MQSMKETTMTHETESSYIDSWRMQDGHNGVPETPEKAFALAQVGVASGCNHSKGALARCYFYGYGVGLDAAVALALAEESAAANSPYGHFILGRCLHEGRGGAAQDLGLALVQYRIAADQKLAISQYYLGMMLFFGLGVEANEEEAEMLWHLAALQGYDLSYRMLAYMYEMDEREPSRNPAVAKIFEASAKMGDANAQYQLGLMYEGGRGVFADTKKALKLYKSAMLQGHDRAEAALIAALTCGECCSKYDRHLRVPLLLPCGCTFCEQCISRGARGRVVKCPSCGSRVCSTAELPTNEGVRAALGKTKLPQQQQRKGLKRKQLQRAAPQVPGTQW
jgi:TPR repeat protein